MRVFVTAIGAATGRISKASVVGFKWRCSDISVLDTEMEARPE